jgi:hypothetical protein
MCLVSFEDGMPAGMLLISRAAATPTLRAYRSAQTPTGIIDNRMQPLLAMDA